ncbi:MAG: VUT family protein [Runella slithyformis]|nr:MAG: VUT family protein [Runella slithyformis]TAG21056.1 MAG: VUT family protein [Cytophagales bacterium]TAG40426.1 MAG: VUT family protein [Cytophagia bacterium]TAE94404.1 MAG: VUT family protein [Runella slithyformis]TAF25692.1 MAG: VUT family protein [Runella slithyformis]
MPTFPVSFESKKQSLFLFLCGLFLTNALIAEIIGAKIFSVEALLGMSPAQIPLFGTQLDFNMSAGVVNWPVVFITSDIINEYFGKRGVRRISYLTAGFIVYMFVAIYATTELPPAQFWLDVNKTDSLGNPLNIGEGFNKIFRQGLGIMVGSVVAFLIGQILDVTIFAWLRKRTGSKQIWLRATGSTLFSQLVDSFVVIFIAFYLFGDWSVTQVLSVGSINYIYKGIVALMMTPILYIAHAVINRYLGEENAHKLAEEAHSQVEE